MISFFPDVNVWLALSIADHSHSEDAWRWLGSLTSDASLAFGRYTQLGMLRVLTNAQVMGAKPLTLAKAWAVYDRWLEDPRVEYFAEPRSVDAAFRDLTKTHANNRNREMSRTDRNCPAHRLLKRCGGSSLGAELTARASKHG